MDIKLSAQIEQALKDRPEDLPRNYIGASSIGHDCSRAIWYQANEIMPDVSHRLKRIFDTGKVIEKMLLEYIELTKIKVVRPTPGNNYLECHDKDAPYFAGHMDAILLPPDGPTCILDIKTTNDINFKKFVNNGLKFWQPKYYAQLQAYMGMTGHKYAILLAYNKDDSRLHDETIEYDSIEYEILREKAHSIHDLDEPPPRINKSPMYFVCRQCLYKGVCHDRDIVGN